MKILITGGCGFVGTNLCLYLNDRGHKIYSLDNLSRKGSKYNLNLLKKNKIKNYRFDIANFKNIEILPKFDLIIDCCAEAAVEISKKEIDLVFNTNLIGTFNILKKAKADKSKIIFLSTSRVYPIKMLNNLINKNNIKYKIVSRKKINEHTSTNGPKSIYGFTKISSEMLIEEFAYQFNLKYIVNRCGVISGPLQFGKQDQGFVSLWIWKHFNKLKLNYIGFGGFGNQVRDVLHIDDLCSLINIQINKINKIHNKFFTVGGSNHSKVSLRELTRICQKITGNFIKIGKIKKTSNYDIPYYVTDNSKIKKIYNWKVKKNIHDIVNDIYNWFVKDKKVINKYF